jgi:hypothetical protein
MANENTPANAVETVVSLPLSSVLFDWGWNVRTRPTIVDPATGKRLMPTATPDQEKAGETGFAGLYTSIKIDGQRDAITVRVNPDAKTRGKYPYACVAGFSRGEALAMIADETGDKAPTVKAIIREYTETQARKENLRENAGGRVKLTGPDLMFGIQKLREQDRTLTPTAIAQSIGSNQAYVNTLCKIADKAKAPGLLDAWRASKHPIPYAAMKALTEKHETAEDQKKAFDALCKPKAAPGSAPTAGRDSWVNGAVERASASGFAIGLACQHGALTVTDRKTFFRDYVSTFAPFKAAPTTVAKSDKGDDEKRLREAQAKHAEYAAVIVAAFKAGYDKGHAYTPPVETPAEPKADKSAAGDAKKKK